MKIEETIRYTHARWQDKTAVGKRHLVDAASVSPISVGIAELQDVLDSSLKMMRHSCVVIISISIEEE